MGGPAKEPKVNIIPTSCQLNAATVPFYFTRYVFPSVADRLVAASTKQSRQAYAVRGAAIVGNQANIADQKLVLVKPLALYRGDKGQPVREILAKLHHSQIVFRVDSIVRTRPVETFRLATDFPCNLRLFIEFITIADGYIEGSIAFTGGILVLQVEEYVGALPWLEFKLRRNEELFSRTVVTPVLAIFTSHGHAVVQGVAPQLK